VSGQLAQPLSFGLDASRTPVSKVALVGRENRTRHGIILVMYTMTVYSSAISL